jgi:hypothetical protein
MGKERVRNVRLTTETPIIHLLLSQSIKDRVHIGCSLGRVNEFAVLTHHIPTSSGLIFSIRIHLPSLEFYVPWVIVEGVFSLLTAVITSGGRFGSAYAAGIKAEKMKLLTDDLVDLSTSTAEKSNATTCGRISISFSLESSVDGTYHQGHQG